MTLAVHPPFLFLSIASHAGLTFVILLLAMEIGLRTVSIRYVTAGLLSTSKPLSSMNSLHPWTSSNQVQENDLENGIGKETDGGGPDVRITVWSKPFLRVCVLGSLTEQLNLSWSLPKVDGCPKLQMPVFKRTAKGSNGKKSLPERDGDSSLIPLSFQGSPHSFLVLWNFIDTVSTNVYFCLSHFEFLSLIAVGTSSSGCGSSSSNASQHEKEPCLRGRFPCHSMDFVIFLNFAKHP